MNGKPTELELTLSTDEGEELLLLLMRNNIIEDGMLVLPEFLISLGKTLCKMYGYVDLFQTEMPE